MPLEFKPDFEEAARRWDALYHHEIIDRPVTCITVPTRDTPEREPQYLAPVAEGIECTLDMFETYLLSHAFLGEAMPGYAPSAGPDMFAAFLGTELRYDLSVYPERWPHSWAVKWVDSWDDVSLDLKRNNEVFAGMMHALKRTAERGRGRYLSNPLDLHSNYDALAAMRGPENLIYDMVDDKEGMLRLGDRLNEIFRQISDAMFEANACEQGTCRGLFLQGKTNIIACDFAAMLSPELFDTFVMPCVEYEADYLERSMFHVDGPDMYKHLDSVLSVPRIDAINWVPGVQHGPNRRFASWIDFFRKVQDAGKIMQIYNVTVDEVKMLHRELKPDLVYYSVTGVNAVGEAEELLSWLTQNT